MFNNRRSSPADADAAGDDVDAAGADVDSALVPFVVSSAAEIQPGPEADAAVKLAAVKLAAVKLAAAAGVVVVVVWLQGWVGLCCVVAGVVAAGVAVRQFAALMPVLFF